jgi:hypothetical protein
MPEAPQRRPWAKVIWLWVFLITVFWSVFLLLDRR